MDAIERRTMARLAQVRRHRELSQRQLSAASGINKDVIWRLEAGQRHLKIDEAAALCRALDVDLSEVVADAPLVLRTEKVFE